MGQSSDQLRLAVSQTCERQGLDPALPPGETIRPPQLAMLYAPTLAPPAASVSNTEERESGLGDLRLGDTLGRGGMGWVRVAEQGSIGRTVAVKTLRPERRNVDAAAALVREAQVTGRLEHPNIVARARPRRERAGRALSRDEARRGRLI